MNPLSFWLAGGMVLVAAIITDIQKRSIPNLITIGGIFLGIVIHVAAGFVDTGILGALKQGGLSLGGAVACGAIPYIFWRRGSLGGGDVKLLAALGSLLGPALGFDVQMFTFALALFVLFPYRIFRYGLSRKVNKDKPVILAPTIGAAFALAFVAHGGLLHG